MGLAGAGIAAAGEKEQLGAAKDELDRIGSERKRSLGLVDKLDWTPERVSAALGSYKRSESPVADAWMQSMLTGDNPALIQDTRAGATRLKAQAAQRFDQKYGGWDKLRQQDAEMRQSQPWALKDVAEADARAGGKPAFEASPDAAYLDEDQVSALREQGLKFKDGKPDKKSLDQIKFWTKGLGDIEARGGKGQQFMQALSAYLQQGGSWKALTIDNPANKKGRDNRIDVDAFIEQYRPGGSVSLAKPSPGGVV